MKVGNLIQKYVCCDRGIALRQTQNSLRGKSLLDCIESRNICGSGLEKVAILVAHYQITLMVGNTTSIWLILVLCMGSFTFSLAQKYTCGLTEEEYLKSKDFNNKMKETDRRRVKKLKRVNPSFAYEYSQLKTQTEKADYLTYLVNHVFDTVDIHHPENRSIAEFLKSLEFAVVSAKDLERCYPVVEELRRQYQDSLRFYYSSLPGSGCEVSVYEITETEDIESLACFLSTIADQYETGTLYVEFYEKEVFAPERSLEDGTATIKARGEETLIEKLLINIKSQKRKDSRY